MERWLQSGCWCRCVRLFDCQTPSDPQVWRLSGEVEKVVWNHLQPETFLVGHLSLQWMLALPSEVHACLVLW